MEISIGKKTVKMAGVWTARLRLGCSDYTGRRNARLEKLNK